MSLRAIAATLILTIACFAQKAELKPDPNAPLPSPVANISVKLAGKDVAIRYNAPSMRGRKIMGALVPFDQVWRTGANDATSLVTAVPLTIGNLTVPAGSYTIYSLPNADPAKWQLIINKQTKQWGTEYHAEQDLGRTPMQHATFPKPQEVMSLSFEHSNARSTQLHMRWETTDEWVTLTAH